METFDSIKYAEICPECDSWNLRISNEHLEEDQCWHFDVSCRNCGLEWSDWLDR